MLAIFWRRAGKASGPNRSQEERKAGFRMTDSEMNLVLLPGPLAQVGGGELLAIFWRRAATASYPNGSQEERKADLRMTDSEMNLVFPYGSLAQVGGG